MSKEVVEILITNNHLCQFQGSELVAVELAEYYASLGNNVTLYAPEIAPPLLPTINRERLELTTTLPEDLSRFDIIWSHHGLVIDKYKKRSGQLVISNHMSPFVELEKPKYDAALVDFIFANSEETIHSLPSAHAKKAQLFQNPAPMVTTQAIVANCPLPTGVSISNHRPAELVFFMVDNSKTINFEVFGMNSKNYIRMSPNVLKEINPDFVVCNGKSVIYALAAKIPIFIYDSYGGCGWLNAENFPVAEHYNFSGRGFPDKPDLNTLLDFENQTPIELGEHAWKFNLDSWVKRMGLF